jgi:site-specific recombinase XerD
VLELSDCLGLDLPDALARYRKLLADLLQRVVASHADTKAHAYDALYTLANKGVDTRSLQAYLGHRNIQHTVRYSELTPTRFKDFWKV